MRKIKIVVTCSKCGLRHKNKECPILYGALLPKWKDWAKSYARVRYVMGEKFPL